MLSGALKDKNETGAFACSFFLLNVYICCIAMRSSLKKKKKFVKMPTSVRSGFQSLLVSHNGRYMKPNLKPSFTIVCRCSNNITISFGFVGQFVTVLTLATWK